MNKKVSILLLSCFLGTTALQSLQASIIPQWLTPKKALVGAVVGGATVGTYLCWGKIKSAWQGITSASSATWQKVTNAPAATWAAITAHPIKTTVYGALTIAALIGGGYLYCKGCMNTETFKNLLGNKHTTVNA